MRKLRQTGRRLPAGRRLSEALERSPPAARESTSPPLSDAARADARPSTGPIMPAAAGVSTGIPADHVSPVARTVRPGVSARRSGGPPLRPRQLSHKSLSRASTLSPHFPARTRDVGEGTGCLGNQMFVGTKTWSRLSRRSHVRGSTDGVCRSGCRNARSWTAGSPEPEAQRTRWRTCARLCHLTGGELDQTQFLLGHVSIQTTERHLGCSQKLRIAVNDRLGIEPDAA